MADNFDLRQFVTDNKVGPYITNEAKLDISPITGRKIFSNQEGYDDKKEWMKALFRVYPNIQKNPKDFMHEDPKGNINVSKSLQAFGNWWPGRKFGVVYLSQDRDMGKLDEERPVSDYGQRRAGGVSLSAQAIDRIEGLIDDRKLSIVMDTLGEIIEDLQEEDLQEKGFDYEDVLAYLRMQLKDYLG